MTLNDPLANAMTLIMHKEKIGKTICAINPVSKLIKQVLEILNAEKYVGEFTEVPDSKGNVIKLNIIGAINKCGVIKPRFAVKNDEYDKYEQRYLPSRDMGLLIISTSKGLMTNKKAKKEKLGGRLIAYCY